MSLAIVCGSGGYRVVFIQGVLSVFEAEGLRGDCYGGTSASGLAAACAAIGQTNTVGVDYWRKALAFKQTVERGMSDVMLAIIDEWSPMVKERIFLEESPRYIIPASAVITPEGAEITQSGQARRLGRKILLNAARRRPDPWVAENLESHLFDTKANGHLRLTQENFDEVMYASTRMMHAWDVPAEIGGKPYVDASYLCAIPAVEAAEMGYDEVIAIAADPPGPLYRDIFGGREVPGEVNDAQIHTILPEFEVGEKGADFTDATDEGLALVYAHGQDQARAFLKTYKRF